VFQPFLPSAKSERSLIEYWKKAYNYSLLLKTNLIKRGKGVLSTERYYKSRRNVTSSRKGAGGSPLEDKRKEKVCFFTARGQAKRSIKKVMNRLGH